MSYSKKITVLGDGGWGTTLAILLHNKGLDVTLTSLFKDYAAFLDKKRINPNFLKGIKIPSGIKITSDLSSAANCDVVILAIPSEYLRGVLEKSARFYDSRIPVVSVVKGIENKTLLRMSEVVAEVWHSRRIAVLSGPTIALEVASGIPSAAVVSSRDKKFMLDTQGLFMTGNFRIYANPDVAGVELGGSLKNIIAIACGIADGLGFGTNTKAAILARGLAEMSRLGVIMGARRDTFYGLAGVGDLVTTCFNPLSRNHYVGERIGKGYSLRQIASTMKMVAEGVPTARSAFMLGQRYGVELPITNQIYSVLFRNKSPLSAVKQLMLRKRKGE